MSSRSVEKEEEDRIYVNVLMGDRLKYIRQAINVNQDKMAEKLCINTARLSTIETGKATRNFSILIRLLLVFQRVDVTFNDLVSEKFDRKEIKKRIQEARARNRENVVIKASSVIVKTR